MWTFFWKPPFLKKIHNSLKNIFCTLFLSLFFIGRPPKKTFLKKLKNAVFWHPVFARKKRNFDNNFFIKLYRSLGVCVLNLGSVSSLFPEIKNRSRRRYFITYLRSPNGDIEDLTSYPVPRASDEYTCKSRTG